MLPREGNKISSRARLILAEEKAKAVIANNSRNGSGSDWVLRKTRPVITILW